LSLNGDDNIPQTEACIYSVSLNETLDGSWTSGCESVHRPGSYARYYTVSVPPLTYINIDLESDTQDTYLFLLEGDGMNGSVLSKNDDWESGNTDSYIGKSLLSDTYTIEATTFDNGAMGSFTLFVTDERPVYPQPSDDGRSWTTGAYSNNEDRIETLSVPGADHLSVTVTGETERGYDYVYIYDNNDNCVENFSGTIDETFTLSGDSITVRLISDHSITGEGVTVSVQGVSDEEGDFGTETSHSDYNLGIDIVKTYLTLDDRTKAVACLDLLQKELLVLEFLDGFSRYSDGTEQVLYALEFFLRHSSYVLFGDLLPEGSIVATYQTIQGHYDELAKFAGVCHELYVKVQEPGMFSMWNNVDDASVNIYQIATRNKETEEFEITGLDSGVSYEGRFMGWYYGYGFSTSPTEDDIPSGIYIIEVNIDGREPILDTVIVPAENDYSHTVYVD